VAVALKGGTVDDVVVDGSVAPEAGVVGVVEPGWASGAAGDLEQAPRASSSTGTAAHAVRRLHTTS
jgi:hypothetical protein